MLALPAPATAERALECKSSRLIATRHGIYASRVDLARNFVSSPSGRYAVSWRYEGFRVGRTLHFRKR